MINLIECYYYYFFYFFFFLLLLLLSSSSYVCCWVFVGFSLLFCFVLLLFTEIIWGVSLLSELPDFKSW